MYGLKVVHASRREDALRKGSVDAPETTGSAPEPAPAAIDLKVQCSTYNSSLIK